MLLIADGLDRDEWWAAHQSGISASVIGKAMTPAGRRTFVDEFMHPKPLDDDSLKNMVKYMEHGRRREDEFIGPWVEKRFNIQPNKAIWARDIDHLHHLATPDGYNWLTGEISEFKTATVPPPKTIKKAHRDQMQWQMLVSGAKRCLYVYEQHEDFRPVGPPETRWLDRDDERIEQLIKVADSLWFEIEMARAA